MAVNGGSPREPGVTMLIVHASRRLARSHFPRAETVSAEGERARCDWACAASVSEAGVSCSAHTGRLKGPGRPEGPPATDEKTSSGCHDTRPQLDRPQHLKD
ncbi:hypothetical protein AAFF_G00393380 [Aldrovandia affinis]|uniref:Uncharacterized protein n=1 Tax=Aldrovandia affinis TaxID=143900 RepID=A0AAD7SDJ7_9TELE|nr:hypothetical protein AAFF_G00393380 [Aldrovandia affinis]